MASGYHQWDLIATVVQVHWPVATDYGHTKSSTPTVKTGTSIVWESSSGDEGKPLPRFSPHRGTFAVCFWPGAITNGISSPRWFKYTGHGQQTDKNENTTHSCGHPLLETRGNLHLASRRTEALSLFWMASGQWDLITTVVQVHWPRTTDTQNHQPQQLKQVHPSCGHPVLETREHLYLAFRRTEALSLFCMGSGHHKWDLIATVVQVHWPRKTGTQNHQPQQFKQVHPSCGHPVLETRENLHLASRRTEALSLFFYGQWLSPIESHRHGGSSTLATDHKLTKSPTQLVSVGIQFWRRGNISTSLLAGQRHSRCFFMTSGYHRKSLIATVVQVHWPRTTN